MSVDRICGIPAGDFIALPTLERLKLFLVKEIVPDLAAIFGIYILLEVINWALRWMA